MKVFKKFLSALLVAVMIIGVAPLNAFDFDVSAAETTYKTGDIIEFGSYPQSKVTDSTTLSKLKAVTKNWISYGYYSGTGKWDDGNMIPSDYMKYADITLDGNKYRAVTFSKYRKYDTNYTAGTSTSYTYQNKNGYYINNVYYFKYEPLKWVVLDASTALVVCNSAIDSQAYNNYVLSSDGHYGDSTKTHYASDWEHSSLRAWLNNDFLNTAFTSSQQSKIKTVTRETKSEYNNSQYDSNPTSDKITLLSYWDVLNTSYGFNSSYNAYDTARQRKSTDYAKCQGCDVSSSYKTSSWRLRSPYNSSGATGVSDDGRSSNHSYVSNTSLGIVPALNLDFKLYNDNTFYENSYIADIWLSQGREETVENKLINSVLDLDSVSTVIYDDLKNNKSFQNSVKGWTGFEVVFDPEKGIDDIFLSESELYETLIFDLVKKILYGKSEDTGNIVLDATENVDEVLSEVTKYKGYISKLQTITTAPEKNLLEVLKTWRIDANSTTFFKFYGMLNDAEQATAKWSDNKFIEGIGTIADISSDVNDFYKRFASYSMLRDMSDETLMLLEEMNAQTENINLKIALQIAIEAVKNVDIIKLACADRLLLDMDLDIAGAFFDDISKGSVIYTTLRTGYKVGVAICDITMNTSKILDAYKACGATKNFIAANKAAINSLAQKYLSSGSELDAAVYVNAVRSYQYATEIDFENSVSFVKKASEQGLWNQAKNLTAGIINFFLNKDSKTTYESMVESQKTVSTNMEQIYSILDNSWKFNADYLKTDYPDIYPVYVKKEISQKQYAPNINSAYIDKSGTTKINWSFPLTFKDKNGNVQTLWGVMAYDGIEATETIGNYEYKKSYSRSAAPSTIEFYNESRFNTFNKDYTLRAFSVTNSETIYSAESKVSISNPLLKPQISPVGMRESGGAQSMFTINDNTNSRYDSVRYIIYRKSGNGSWKEIDDIPRDMNRFDGKLTLYKDVTAQKGEKYTYKVGSYMKFDNGITLTSPETDTTSVIGGIGNIGLNLNVRDFTSRARTRSIVAEESGIELSWSAVEDAAGYEIYRIASYGTIYQLIETVDSSVTSYVDYDIDAGTTYNYIVCPYNSDSEKTYNLAGFSYGTVDYKVAKVNSVDISDVKIDYKKSTILNPSIIADEGAEYTITYTSDSKNVTVDGNGKIYAAKRGSANITVTVTDSQGNTVTDTCKVEVKYTWWQWIIKIVLFGWIWY